jgi:hypothetical protein
MSNYFRSKEDEKKAMEWLDDYFGFNATNARKCTVTHMPYGDLIKYEDGEEIYISSMDTH